MEILIPLYYWLAIPIGILYLVFTRLPKKTKVHMVVHSPMIDGLIFFIALWVIVGYFTNFWPMFLLLTILALWPDVYAEDSKRNKFENVRAISFLICISIIFLLYLKNY